MNIKVGDRVLYKGHTVRLMGVHPIRLKLSHFGTVDGTVRDLILMESTVLPLLNAGDLVFINNIPQGEKMRTHLIGHRFMRTRLNPKHLIRLTPLGILNTSVLLLKLMIYGFYPII